MVKRSRSRRAAEDAWGLVLLARVAGVAVLTAPRVTVVLKPGTDTAVRSGPGGLLWAWVPLAWVPLGGALPGGALLLAAVRDRGRRLRMPRTAWGLAALGGALLGGAFLTL